MRRGEGGFTLIELMVALTLTLIVSGAIYGLMTSGQGSFRREPALTDRQQNIRVAMDLIARDVEYAGAGMTPFAQVFSNNLNNPGAGSVPSEIFDSERADFIEMMANDGNCPALSLCGSPGGNLFTNEPLPTCMFGNPAGPVYGFVAGPNGPADSDGPDGLLWLEPPGSGGGGGCGNGHVNTPAGQSWVNPGGNQACGGGSNNSTGPLCSSLSKIALVRYELAPENPALALHPINNPPCLWRTEYGRTNLADGSAAGGGPCVTGAAGCDTPWQLVARGIDDMQIEYQNGTRWPATPDVWDPIPGAVTCAASCSNPVPGAAAPTAAEYNSIVRRVRITLSARAIGVNLGGETRYTSAGAGGTPGRRGQLTMIIAPRAAQQAVWTAPAAIAWR